MLSIKTNRENRENIHRENILRVYENNACIGRVNVVKSMRCKFRAVLCGGIRAFTRTLRRVRRILYNEHFRCCCTGLSEERNPCF